MGRGLFRDVRREALIDGGIIVIMPSRPVPVQGSVHPRVQDLRIFLRKPGGRRGRGRAEDHLHGRLLHHIQEGVKKFVGVLPLPGFDLVPGKFRDADDPDARLQHPVQILPPQAPVPVLGIITGSQRQTVSIDDLSHVRSPSFLISGDFVSDASAFRFLPPRPGSFCCARLLLLRPTPFTSSGKPPRGTARSLPPSGETPYGLCV